MKKLLAFLLLGAMLLTFAACGDKPETPETPDAPDAVDTEDTAPAAKEFEVTTATSGNFEITVLGAEAVTTRDDTAGIRIYYEFTNNATYTVKGVDDVPVTATQNGETLNSVFADEMIDIDTTKELFVRPGATIRCTTVRELLDDKAPVTFTVGDYAADADVEVEFDLANLPGAPAEEFAATPITEGLQVEGLATEGTFDEKYAVKILGAEKIEKSNGDVCVLVHYSYTNNSDADKEFFTAVATKVFQDGIQLESTAPADATSQTYKNRFEKVAPGATIEADLCFKLASDSPVEIEVSDKHITNATDDYFEERIGMVFTVA